MYRIIRYVYVEALHGWGCQIFRLLTFSVDWPGESESDGVPGVRITLQDHCREQEDVHQGAGGGKKLAFQERLRASTPEVEYTCSHG